MAGSRLDMLKQIATGLAAQFGDNCEVVVHDLARNVAKVPLSILKMAILQEGR